MKKPLPGTSDTPDTDRPAKQGHSSLAGKVLHVFRVGGDNERSVGRHGQPAAEPEQRRTGPVQQQVISDGNGPVLDRTIADSAPAVTTVPSPLADVSLGQNRTATAPAPTAEAIEPVEPIRLQTFSIDLSERLARTRAAQQDVLRELDKFDETGEDLAKSIDRKR